MASALSCRRVLASQDKDPMPKSKPQEPSWVNSAYELLYNWCKFALTHEGRTKSEKELTFSWFCRHLTCPITDYYTPPHFLCRHTCTEHAWSVTAQTRPLASVAQSMSFSSHIGSSCKGVYTTRMLILIMENPLRISKYVSYEKMYVFCHNVHKRWKAKECHIYEIV